MVGRPGVTMVDVARACLSLRQQRRRLGPTNVRLELGRGSMTTICRHLQRLALRDVDYESAIQDSMGPSFRRQRR